MHNNRIINDTYCKQQKNIHVKTFHAKKKKREIQPNDKLKLNTESESSIFRMCVHLCLQQEQERTLPNVFLII